MLKFMFLCALVLVSAFSAAAQDYSKVEVFGGYSYVRFRGKDGTAKFSYIRRCFQPTRCFRIEIFSHLLAGLQFPILFFR